MRALRNLCARKAQIPSSYMIPPDQLDRKDDHAVVVGGFSDVWKGTFGQKPVALKCLQVYTEDEMAYVWKASSETTHARSLSTNLKTHTRPCLRKLYYGNDFLTRTFCHYWVCRPYLPGCAWYPSGWRREILLNIYRPIPTKIA
jgi:hypothetical protein